jgi:hypothetical protein
VLVVVPDLAVRDNRREFVELGAARSDRELADAATLVGIALGILRREPLVEMIVGGDDDVDAVRVEDVPELLLHLVLASVSPLAEARMMEVGNGAAPAMPSQIGEQPEPLQDVARARTAFRGRGLWRRTLRRLRRTVGDDDAPGAQVVAVIPARSTASWEEVAEVAGDTQR